MKTPLTKVTRTHKAFLKSLKLNPVQQIVGRGGKPFYWVSATKPLTVAPEPTNEKEY
jgi:hypothetical protein